MEFGWNLWPKVHINWEERREEMKKCTWAAKNKDEDFLTWLFKDAWRKQFSVDKYIQCKSQEQVWQKKKWRTEGNGAGRIRKEWWLVQLIDCLAFYVDRGEEVGLIELERGRKKDMERLGLIFQIRKIGGWKGEVRSRLDWRSEKRQFPGVLTMGEHVIDWLFLKWVEVGV